MLTPSLNLAFFSPGDACLVQIVKRFYETRKTADVCVFTITDNRITNALLAAHNRGVKIRVITDNDKAFDQGSDIEQIESAGVELKIDRTPHHMHHKFVIFDGARLVNGSYNWTRSAADYNLENIMDLGDPGLIATFTHYFDTLWAKLS